MRSRYHWFLAAAMALLAVSHPAAQKSDPPPRPDLVREPFSEADVGFMSGMIPHHAQAVLICGMGGLPWRADGRAHALRAHRRRLRRDEIEMMRNWLRDRGEAVPAADATHHRMKMHGVEHDMLMPGMLTPEDLAQLDKARNAEWDALFLKAMIRHHEGALKMVDDLFESHGAMQDEDVFKFVSDVYADQTAEIERMQKMLAEAEKRSPQ